MYKYQVEVSEHIPKEEVKRFSKRVRKKLIEDDDYYLNTIYFGRYEEFEPAMIVSDLLEVVWKKYCRYDYEIYVVEVEELAQGVLYRPKEYNA